MKLRNLGALGVAVLLAAGACQQGTAPGASGGAKGTLKLGIDLPLSGGEVANGEPTRNGVQLAVKQANEKGGVNGWKIELNIQDDAVNGVHDPQQGAKNVQTLAADTSVVAMVGPYNSNVAKAQIPITNEAGLLQCSPANTNFGLTIPKYGAKDLRPKNPDKINYVRVATTDLSQGAAGAARAYELGKKVYIVDDTETFGKGVADVFEEEFKKLGGTVVKRDGQPKSNSDYTSLLTAAKALGPDVVYFGGTTPTGGGLLRKQMASAGMGSLPFVGPDGIVDGPGGQQGSFITVAGKDAAANSYGTIAAIHDIPNPQAFADAYTKEYTKAPGAYSAPAYACTQVILTALEKASGSTTDPKAIREAIRAYVTTPANKFDTVLGPLNFDENGDTSQKIISYYKSDPTAAGGKGDWVFEKQQDFAGK
jgi:branched-chain amino acid transport system substrate-binding protein